MSNNFIDNDIISGNQDTGLSTAVNGAGVVGPKVNANPPMGPTDEQLTAPQFNEVTSALTDTKAVVLRLTGQIGGITATAGGDLTGTYPNPTIASLQGNTLTASGTPTTGNVLTFNGTAWVPAPTGTPSGTASGDLGGTYPSPTIASLQGNPILASTPSGGDALTWNGTDWVPAQVAVVLPNIAALRTAPVPAAGTLYEVLGFATAGDGGGGLFYWDTSWTDASTDNVGCIIASSVSGAGVWTREGFNIRPSGGPAYVKVPSALNARWFGAFGDGVTDDTAALQSALRAAFKFAQLLNYEYDPLGGLANPALVSVYLPPARYLITSNLYLSSFCAIEGGQGTVIESASNIILLRVAGAFCNVRNIKFVGGLHSIALFGLADPVLFGANAYNGPTNFGNVLCNIDQCEFWYPTGPAIWQDCSPLASVASLSNGVTLPISGGTIYVNSTANWPTSGPLNVILQNGLTATFSYTGTTPTSFTGVTGGTGSPPGPYTGPGTLHTNDIVCLSNNYRSFQTVLRVTNFYMAGASIYWGSGDSATFTNGHLAYDFTHTLPTGDGYPLGMFNGSDNLTVDNITAFGSGTSTTRQAMFVFGGNSALNASNSGFGQTDYICMLRSRTYANTFQGAAAIAIPTPDFNNPALTPAFGPSVIFENCGFTLIFDGNLVEAYEAFPASIQVRSQVNNYPDDGDSTFGIWVDAATISVASIQAQNLPGQFLLTDGLPTPNSRIYRGFDTGVSVVPSLATATDISSVLYTKNANLVPRITMGGQPNLMVYPAAGGFFSLGGGTNTNTDSSTGYTLTLWEGTNVATGGAATFSFPSSDLIPSGLPAGMYTFSFYWRANFDGIWTLSYDNVGTNQVYVDFRNTESGYQRIEFPFYYPGNNATLTIAGTTNAQVPSIITVWAPTTSYAAAPGPINIAQRVTNGGNIYLCTQSGTSAGSGGPTGTGSGILDGSVKWDYVGPGGTWTPTVACGLWMLNAGDRAAPYVFPSNADVNGDFNIVPRIYYGTASPTSGNYVLGDLCYNTAPSIGGFVGWVCTTAGSPGTWEGFGPAGGGGTPSGPAGGDLTGTYPNPTIAKLQGQSVSAASPSTGNVLTWNGSNWVPSAPAGASGSAGGDLSGTYPNPEVVSALSDALSFVSSPGVGFKVNTASTSAYIEGKASAGGAQVILDNATAATSGDSTISLRSGGSELASFDYQGNLNIGPKTSSTNASPTLFLNASTGTGCSISDKSSSSFLVYDTPSNYFHVWEINGTSYMQLASNVTATGVLNTPQLIYPVSTGALTLSGNLGPSVGPSVILDSQGSVTSGQDVSFRNNGTEIASIDFAGNLNLRTSGGTSGTLTPAIYFNAASGGVAYQSSITSSSTGFLTYNAAATAHTFDIAGTTYLSLDTTALRLEHGVLGVYQNQASTALSLVGKQSATGGAGWILDNAVAATSGTIGSFQSGGTELASIDYQGQMAVTQLVSNGQQLITGSSISGSTGLTTPVVASTANDMCGNVSFTGATAGYSDTTLFVITWTKPFPTQAYCIVAPANNATALAFGGTIWTTLGNGAVSVRGTGNTTAVGGPYSFTWICVGA
jgi:hypothetical protein